MIQISPPIEKNSPVSGAEAPRQAGPAKKESPGVFAKILAGLLRKAGEKDAPAISAGDEAAGVKQLRRGIQKSKSPDSEEPSVLVSGQRGAEGKKPAGILKREIAGADLVQDKTGLWAGTAGDLADRKQSRDGVSGDYRMGSVFREPRNTGWSPGDAPRIPVKPELSPAGGEAISAEGEEEVFPALDSLDFGALLGAEGDGAAEGAENPGGRRGKAGGVYADSPAENSSLRPEAAAPGLAPGGLRRGGSGEGEGGEPRSRLTEARQKGKRRDKITLEVQDFRTGEGRNAGALASPSVQGLENRLPAGRGEAEILVELRGGNPGREAPQTADHTWESRAGRSFEDFLARELHQNLNGDIVRHASVALRDGGEGTIRLSLRPESLGNVKIRLEMADNKVRGHIIVESEAALRAFEREVSSLEQAFRDSGFEGADLDMSLSREGGMGGWNGENPDRPAIPEGLAALRYEAVPEGPDILTVEAPAGVFTRNGRAAVNMLV